MQRFFLNKPHQKKIYVRLVHPLDEQKRRELMIIYDEPPDLPLPSCRRAAKHTTIGR